MKNNQQMTALTRACARLTCGVLLMFHAFPFLFFHLCFFALLCDAVLSQKEPQTFISVLKDGGNLPIRRFGHGKAGMIVSWWFSSPPVMPETMEDVSHVSLSTCLQYIGSLEVGRPSSRVEIVAAMRRIRVRCSQRQLLSDPITSRL